MTRDQIIESALQLPPADRAFVLNALQNSFDDPTNPLDIPHEIDEDSPDAIQGEELLKELDRRVAAYRSGESKSYSFEEVLEEIRRDQEAEA